MVIYLYRWRVKPEKETQFEKAWSYVTDQLREKSGSRGSRLHKGDDGLWYGYAQWPSVDVREASSLKHDEILEARRLMKDATIEMLPDVILTPVSDFLILPLKK
ncbi:MAG TPA: antibiotic biosynthesis monooxygenase [Bdellovibrio sp.]|nr:antibiotic biosynthesis monooxygenase [Bdellovibrio sp.]